jgi:hypothetical protein
MKMNRILPLAGVLTLLCGAASAQMNIPAGAGAGVYRTTPGAPAGHAFNPWHTHHAVSQRCSQRANAQGLHGWARRTFRNKCIRSGGR